MALFNDVLQKGTPPKAPSVNPTKSIFGDVLGQQAAPSPSVNPLTSSPVKKPGLLQKGSDLALGFRRGLLGAGQTPVRLLATLLASAGSVATGKVSQAQNQQQQAGGFSVEQFKEGAPTLSEQVNTLNAKREVQGKPSKLTTFSSALAAATAPIAETFGDPGNIALGFGSQLGRSGVTIGEASLGVGPGKTKTPDQPVDLKKLIPGMQEQSALQVERFNPDAAKSIRALDLSNSKNIAEAENIVKEVLPKTFTPGQTGDALAYFRSGEQIRFSGVEDVPLPNQINLDAKIPGTEQTLSRAKQFQGYAQGLVQQVEKDPAVLEKLSGLGGGKIQSNAKTIQLAAKDLQNEGLDTFTQKLSTWKANTPVSAPDTAKANIVMKFWTDAYTHALETGNSKAVDEALRTISDIHPGYINITAESGRGLEIQSAFKDEIKFAQHIKQLQEERAPLSVVNDEIAKYQKQLKATGILRKFGGTLDEFSRSVENYATAVKLTSVVTHVVNTVSNAITATWRATEKLATAGQRLAKGDVGGAKAAAKFAFGTGFGWRSAVRKFGSVLVDEQSVLGKTETNTKTFQGRIAAKLPTKVLKPLRVGNPFRWLSAADSFWKTIITDSEIHERAYLTALRNKPGVSPNEFAQEFNSLLKDHPVSWDEAASNVAKEYTFQANADKIAKAFMAVRNIPGGRILVPFVLTPYNIVKFQLERSPLGLVSPRNVQDIFKGSTSREEALSRLLVGGGLSTGAYFLVLHNQVTGAYPQDSSEAALWKAEGKTPYSIRIGSKWVQYNRVQPLGLYLTQAAAVHDLVRSGDWKRADLLGAAMTFQTVQAVKDLTFVSGVSALFDSLGEKFDPSNPEKYLQRLRGLVAQGFFPNGLRDTRQQLDVNKRIAKTPTEQIQNLIPGLSQRLPKDIDILGNAVRYEQNRTLRLSKVVTTVRENSATKILEDSGYSPVIPSTRLSVARRGKSFSVDLKGKEKEKFLQESGQATSTAILYASKLPGYNKLDKDTKTYILKLFIERARQVVANKWKADKLKVK